MRVARGNIPEEREPREHGAILSTFSKDAFVATHQAVPEELNMDVLDEFLLSSEPDPVIRVVKALFQIESEDRVVVKFNKCPFNFIISVSEMLAIVSYMLPRSYEEDKLLKSQKKKKKRGKGSHPVLLMLMFLAIISMSSGLFTVWVVLYGSTATCCRMSMGFQLIVLALISQWVRC